MAPKTSLSVKGKLLSGFLLSLLGLCFFSFSPFKLSLLFFSPFLVEVLLYCSLPTSLWLAALTGCLMDLLSSTPFGLFTLNFTFCSALFYRFRQLFNDKIHSMTIFTFFLSASISTLYPILLYFLGKRISLHLVWVATDIIFMPLLDALYAVLFVFIPQIALQHVYKKTLRFLINKKWITLKRS